MTGGKGKNSKIDDPDFAKAVALAYVEGCSQAEMMEMFGVKKRHTIGIWCRDPRVKAHAAKIAQDRVLRIVSKTDTEIERRVADLEDEDIDTILKIRKEYMAHAVSVDVNGGVTADTVTDTLEALDENPELAAGLAELLGGKPKDK